MRRPELVAQGLQTLELCVDNLTPEFFDPTLSPVLRDLMGPSMTFSGPCNILIFRHTRRSAFSANLVVGIAA